MKFRSMDMSASAPEDLEVLTVMNPSHNVEVTHVETALNALKFLALLNVNVKVDGPGFSAKSTKMIVRLNLARMEEHVGMKLMALGVNVWLAMKEVNVRSILMNVLVILAGIMESKCNDQ